MTLAYSADRAVLKASLKEKKKPKLVDYAIYSTSTRVTYSPIRRFFRRDSMASSLCAPVPWGIWLSDALLPILDS